ncbi:class I SAM-dependent methyltransferase [Streptomyces sp. NPDC050560]|uniref:class I SAM-dependent methyltransferase n=1 Tax=Streptomyces sp. NPDC050560 TaxID=3365630 RepID=UPI0037B800CE
MTLTLVRHHPRPTSPTPSVDARARARDWAEIQERMLVPLYEAVYERLEVGEPTRLLGVGCGSGLALLLAARRGARVTGVDAESPELLALARRRLGAGGDARARDGVRVLDGADVAAAGGAPYSLVSAFHPVGCVSGDRERLTADLAATLPLARRGSPVVLTSWGPPERCATSSVLHTVMRLAAPRCDDGDRGAWRPAERDELEAVCTLAGLRPDGSGRVACPFGYAGVDSAVRGLLSTGLLDGAVAATDAERVRKELEEALHPYVRGDGTVWMPNVFRYLISRTV